MARRGRAWLREALMCLGDKPEMAFAAYRRDAGKRLRHAEHD